MQTGPTWSITVPNDESGYALPNIYKTSAQSAFETAVVVVDETPPVLLRSI